MIYRFLFPALTVLLSAAAAAPQQSDVVVYGGTSAAITAAVQAKRMGNPSSWFARQASRRPLRGGLGCTDTGNKAVIGGLSREFYHRVWHHYDRARRLAVAEARAVRQQRPGDAGRRRRQRTMWIFEPHVAEQVFEDFVSEHKIPVVRDEWLDRAEGRQEGGDRITSITTLGGKTYAGKMFIDATYEGDLMAAAGVDYHVGRESNGDVRRESGTACRPACCTTATTSAPQDEHQPLRRPGRPQERRASPGSRPSRPAKYGAADKKRAGLLLPHVPDRPPGQPHPLSQARRLRSQAIRVAAARLRRRAGARPSRSSTRSPTARPTPTTTARSAPTTSA